MKKESKSQRDDGGWKRTATRREPSHEQREQTALKLTGPVTLSQDSVRQRKSTERRTVKEIDGRECKFAC